MLNALAKFVLLLLVGFVFSLYHGFVLSYLWEWFMAGPLKAPGPGWTAWVGISFFVKVLFVNISSLKDSEDTGDLSHSLTKRLKELGIGFVVVTLLLGLGFVYHAALYR